VGGWQSTIANKQFPLKTIFKGVESSCSSVSISRRLHLQMGGKRMNARDEQTTIICSSNMACSVMVMDMYSSQKCWNGQKCQFSWLLRNALFSCVCVREAKRHHFIPSHARDSPNFHSHLSLLLLLLLECKKKCAIKYENSSLSYKFLSGMNTSRPCCGGWGELCGERIACSKECEYLY
jgi:hypothetical protein